MLTRELFNSYAENYLSFNKYPAVRYKALLHLLDIPRDDERLTTLRPEFMQSDIVRELYEEQDRNGNWEPLLSKDYKVKSKFPTNTVAINRCLYIGLTKDDGDMLFMALDNLEDMLRDRYIDPRYSKNERAPVYFEYAVATLAEAIDPHNALADDPYEKWLYIANEAFAAGEYSYEAEARAQREIYGIKRERLCPVPVNLLLSRKDRLSAELEDRMLHHYGRHVYNNGHIWFYPNPNPQNLPESFENDKTRRLFMSTSYLNMFRNNACYMDEVVEWILRHRNADGLWDYGNQTKDPWGYFEYLSVTRNYKYNRIINCTMEVLITLKKYLDSNFIYE